MIVYTILLVCTLNAPICEPPPVLSPEPLRIEVPPTRITLAEANRAVADANTPEPEPLPLAATTDTTLWRDTSRRDWGGSVEEWRPLVAGFFPPEQVEMALCVIAGESRGNPNADNPRSSAAGLWQFLKSTWDNVVPRSVTGGTYASGLVYQPEASTRAAAWLWANLGWSQWNAARRC